MKKLILLIFLTSIVQITKSQIKGSIVTRNNIPLSFASVVIGNGVGCMSDSIGHFEINSAKIGDTLQVFHLNVCNKTIVIDSSYMHIKVIPKEYKLDEIKVSNTYAFELFEKSKIKTYSLLQNKYVRHAYWQGLEINNQDTLLKAIFDLDIKQSQLYKIGKGSLLKVKVIDGAIKKYPIKNEKDIQLPFQSKLTPFENNFLIYKDFINEYSCTIQELDTTITLRFYPKKHIKKGYNNIEVSIFKVSQRINYIASCTAIQNQQYGAIKTIKGEKLQGIEIALYAQYSYTESSAWLSYYEMKKSFRVIHSTGHSDLYNHISNYKVYQCNANERTGKNIYDNLIISKIDNLKSFDSNNINEKLSLEMSYDYNLLRNYIY